MQDEARVGQKGTLTYVWGEKGTRPRAVRDQRYECAYIFGAVCPARGVGAERWLGLSAQVVCVKFCKLMERAWRYWFWGWFSSIARSRDLDTLAGGRCCGHAACRNSVFFISFRSLMSR